MNKWPKNHAAKVLRDLPDFRAPGTNFLEQGEIVTVVKEDDRGLFVKRPGTAQYIGLKRENAIPVPNVLNGNPWDTLEEDQALVTDLLDDGFRLVRVPAEGSTRAQWQAFLKIVLDDGPLTIFQHPLITAVYIAEANPTTVSVATEIIGA